MKRMILAVLAMVAIAFLISGCGAFFGKESQYDKGDWYGVGSPRDVERIKQKKLDFKKTEALPLKAAKINEKGETVPVVILPQKEAVAGFKGIVANLNRHNRASIILMGTEIRNYFLSPGQVLKEEYLLPGDYIAIIYIRNRQRGRPWRFTVGSRQVNYMGEIVHWYVPYE